MNGTVMSGWSVSFHYFSFSITYKVQYYHIFKLHNFKLSPPFRQIRYLAVLEKRLNGEKTAHRIDYFEGIHSFLKDDPGVLTYLEERYD